MKKLASSTIGLILGMAFLTQAAWAHGEDKLGPNGGYIRMPGGFHTELKQGSSHGILVYLLDMEWKNPTTKDSLLNVRLKRGERSFELSCKPSKHVFRCQMPKSLKLSPGDEITLKASRAGAIGAEAVYPYPFQLLNAHH